MQPYLVDSDGDGYSDYTEIRGASNPYSFTDRPADTDGDGFSDAEENDSDGDGIADSPPVYLANDAASHPPGGSIAGYLGLTGPVISEFLAENDDGLANTILNAATGLPRKDDWIEIYNPTSAALPLDNWFLTDNSGATVANRTKWRFPAGQSIPARSFMIVMADSTSAYNGTSNPNTTDRGPDASGYFHTNFGLNNNGEYIALNRWTDSNNDGIINSTAELSFGWVGPAQNGQTFGAQQADESMGCYNDPAGALRFGFLRVPTPGRHNSSGYASTLTEPDFTDPATGQPVAAGLRNAGPLSVRLSHPLNRDTDPANDVTLLWTTNSAEPTEFSDAGPEHTFTLNGTTILRAFAVRDGFEKSRAATRSYLFKTSILGTAVPPADHQGARDVQGEFLGLLRGYPEVTENSAFPLLYAMNPDVIAARSSVPQGELTLSQELSAVPIVSIVSAVADVLDLDTGGLYPNSGQTENFLDLSPDPRALDWQRPGTFELFMPDGTSSGQQDVALLMTGGSSIQQDTTRKHNWRIRFDSQFADGELDFPVFTDTSITEFRSLHLKNPTHDSWSNTWGSTGKLGITINGQYSEPWYRVSDIATYSNEGWARAAHLAMGHDAPRARWVHVFLNGIYWGPHQIAERVDDEFMDEHFGNGQYTVVKNGDLGVPDAISGDAADWDLLIAECEQVSVAVQAGNSAAAAAAYADVETLLDVDNYIDYVIVNTFMVNEDWCGNNWRAAADVDSYSTTGNASTDLITAAGSAFSDGAPVAFTSLTGGAGLVLSRLYYVRDANGSSFKLAATAGGAAIDFTSAITGGTLKQIAGQRWKFLIWDAEFSFRPGTETPGLGGNNGYTDPADFLDCSGPMDITKFLRGHAAFDQRFSQRLRKHFFVDAQDSGSGALAIVSGVDRAVSLYQVEMAKFSPVLFCESARWGNMDKTTPHTKTDGAYLAGRPYGDWDRNTGYIVNNWIPQRRAYYLQRMEALGLYVP